jgi:peroxiredoxin
MRFRLSVLATLILVGVTRADDSDKPWQIHGQVVDEQGKPVEDFEAATIWVSNGNLWDERGELLKEEGKLWVNEGVLAASPKHRAKRLPEGRFSLTVDGNPRINLFALDKRHQRGGIVSVDQSAADKPVTIKIAPLTRVTAKVYSTEAGRTPERTNSLIWVPGDKGKYWGLMHCRSLRGQVSFLLPPGSYELEVESKSPNAALPAPKGQTGIRVEIPRGKTTLDLGVLNVERRRDKDGIARDFSQFYGKEPPELAVTDARGVPKEVKLADFRGKWILLDFWEVSCGPCVGRSLPELTKFYEEHAADRDRFEILSICNTEDEKAQTIEAFDALVAPLVKDVWARKQLPFPVLVDGEGKTSSVYGIPIWPTVFLIDREGHLVKDGGLPMLAEKLKEKKP